MNIEIYECEYVDHEQIVSRHYVSSIAKCSFLYETSIDNLRDKLPSNHIETLINEKELVIIDEKLVEKLVGKSLRRDKYIYLLLKLKK